MRFLNLLGNKFFSMMFTYLLDQRFKDTLCGTKVLFRKDYEQLKLSRKFFGDFDPFGDFDLILCGQFAIDGDTAQTGPSIAEHLNLPQITYAKEIESYNGTAIISKREMEEGIQRVEMILPGLVSMLKCDYEPRMPSIKGVMKANRMQIPEISMEDLGMNPDEVGIKGSPTWVSKAFRPPVRETGEIINIDNPVEVSKVLVEKLKNDKIV